MCWAYPSPVLSHSCTGVSMIQGWYGPDRESIPLYIYLWIGYIEQFVFLRCWRGGVSCRRGVGAGRVEGRRRGLDRRSRRATQEISKLEMYLHTGVYIMHCDNPPPPPPSDSFFIIQKDAILGISTHFNAIFTVVPSPFNFCFYFFSLTVINPLPPSP